MDNRKFYIENLGCSKNQVDAEVIISMLEERGWFLATEPEEAEVIIVNTCGFIQGAKEESIETSLGFKAQYPGKKVIMAGCLSERYGEILEKELTELDGFVGNKDLTAVLKLFPAPGEGLPLSGQRKKLLSLPGSSYVKIAEGCDHRCTYCSIPLIRGGLRSRPVSEITAEISGLLDLGIYEFNLIAQDLGSYGRDLGGEEDITTLFRAIAEIKRDFWIRPLYIHPDRFPYALLDIMAEDKRFLPYFDIPFQHASRAILKKMGRAGNRQKYVELIRQIRQRLPEAVIRSTFLVGFPGETDGDFEELLTFQQEASLDWLGIFTYSREEDTPAYDFEGQVEDLDAQERKSELEEEQVPITEERMERFVGRELDILIEEAVEEEELYLGRLYSQAPEVDGLVVLHGKDLLPGSLVRGKIFKRNGLDLEAVVKS